MDSDLLWLILALLVGSVCALSIGNLNRFRRRRQQQHSLPPGDMGWPLIGNMWSFLRAFRSQNPESFINNFRQRYGPAGIYRTNLFWKPSIIVCTPELCRKVLTDEEQFQLGYPLSNIILNGASLDHISSSSNKWFRRLTASGITKQESLSSYIGKIEEIVIHALEEWSGMRRQILFFPEVNKISFKVMMSILLGSSTDDTVIASMEKYYTYVFAGLFCTPINVPGFAYNRALKAREKLVKGIQGVLRDRKLNDPNLKPGLVDFIREAEDEKGEKLDDERVAILLLLFFIAGRESSGRAAAWATVYLHDHPQVLQMAKEEQEEIIKRRPTSQKGLTLNEIKQMKYLSKVIIETMRIRTNIFALFREAKNDTYLNDYFIPKGWKILIWQGTVHMDPEIYPDPKQFLPSRWDDFIPTGGAYFPFGIGSRSCIGADLAKLEISIFLHYFILNYRLEQLNPGGPVNYLPSPDPADNCPAKVIKIR